MPRRMPGTAKGLTALFSSPRSFRSVLWNLLGGGWAGLLIVLATPWYVSRLGLEGYGILGLWLMMQVLMGLLDVGMGATLVREFADFGGSRSSQESKRDLLKTLETVYWAIAVLSTLVLILAAGWLGDHWLKASALPNASVVTAIRMMAISLGLQFPYALYSNGLAGLQEHGRNIALQMVGNGLRYGGGVAVLLWRPDLAWFFAVQVVVAAFQTFAIRRVVWRLVAEVGARPPAFRMERLRKVWRFSAGMAATAVSAVLLANADRVALSKLVPTQALGMYAVAFTATGLLQMGIQPFYRVYFPRYSELVSSGGGRQLRDEYFRSCRTMASVLIPAGIVAWAFAPQLFQAWLGRSDVAIVTIFRWLLIGITCSGLAWLPAALQQAHGWTRLHAAMITGALVLGTPLMLWAIQRYGPVGATAIWVLHGISDITLGLWLMHRRLLPGELPGWYGTVVLPPMLVGPPLVGFSWWLMPSDLGRWASLCWVGTTGLVVVVACLFIHTRVDRGDIRPALANIRGNGS
jgi:O-antigen/teichoic acid export membrane protein